MEQEQNKTMADVCRGLSQVCIILAKEKEAEEKNKSSIRKKKLKVIKKHKMKEIEKFTKDNSKELKKFANDFEKKARVFDDFAKIYNGGLK